MNPLITPRVAAHVLWHAGHGGYEPGAFTRQLLIAWSYADYTNSRRLAAVYPAYGSALAIAAKNNGVQRLRQIMNGESR